VIDEEMRRMKESMALSGQKLPMDMPTKKTFVVNTNSHLIQALYRLKAQDPSLAKEMIHHVYELSLLSQKQF
jgi:HSP90 family molecular chaperone